MAKDGPDQVSITGHETGWHTNSEGVEHRDFYGTRDVARSDGSTGSQTLTDKDGWGKVHEGKDGKLW